MAVALCMVESLRYSSSQMSQNDIGGLVGAALVSSGTEAIYLDGLFKVLLVMFLSPILGFVVGYLMLKVIYFLARGASPRINTLFKRGQLGTSLALALSHATKLRNAARSSSSSWPLNR